MYFWPFEGYICVSEFLLRKDEWEKKNHICVVDIMIFENIVEVMLQSSIERMGACGGWGVRYSVH